MIFIRPNVVAEVVRLWGPARNAPNSYEFSYQKPFRALPGVTMLARNSSSYLAIAASAQLLCAALGGHAKEIVSTTECQILVKARMESEVIDATDSGSYLLSRWKEGNEGFDQVLFWKNGDREEFIPRIDGYTHSQPSGMSANDLVACTALRRGAYLAFVWNPRSGEGISLPLLAGYRASYAHAISNDGRWISGFQTKAKTGNVPVVWSKTSEEKWTCERLSVIHEDNPLLTNAGVRISPNGRIVVAPITVKINQKALSYKSENHMWTPDDTGQWTRQRRTANGLVVNAVNDHGAFVGHDVHAVKGSQYPCAYVCTMEKGVHKIGVLPGDVASDARDINNNGVVVGWSTDPYGRTDPEKDLGYDDPFLWTAEHGMRKINIASTPSPGGHGSVTTITEGNRIGGRVTIVDELNEPAFTAVLIIE